MKITIVGNAYVATSVLSVEDIKLVRKYKPDALKVTNEEGSELFALGYNEQKPGVGTNYITFGGTSKDGKATFTGLLTNTEKAKEVVAEMFGAAIPFINALEETVPVVAKSINDYRNGLLESIEIVG